MLVAYSQFDIAVGYTQGMNFIAALILLHVKDQTLSCQILVKMMEIDNWGRLYIQSTPKLFEVSDQLRAYISSHLKVLNQTLQCHNIFIEALLASPFLTLFANLISIEHSTMVLDRFLLNGQESLMEIIKHLFKHAQEKLSRIGDSFELQMTMKKQIYVDAIESNQFFPPLQLV